MTKVELIAAIAKDAGITQDSARKAFESLWRYVAETVQKGGKVELREIGTFLKRTREQRTGRNPKNGEPIVIPEKTYVAFKPSDKLNESIL